MKENFIAILILAAGSSSRMGKSKQRLIVNDQPLLRKTVLSSLASKANSTTLVLGYEASENKKVIEDLAVEVVVHQNWSEGIGSSLRRGVQEILKKESKTSAILIVVCDQPLLRTSHLDKMIFHFNPNEKSIIASCYNKTIGVPAVFDKQHFPDLLEIDNHQGAKKIIHNNVEKMFSVDFPGGETDLDTPDDYTRFINSTS